MGGGGPPRSDFQEISPSKRARSTACWRLPALSLMNSFFMCHLMVSLLRFMVEAMRLLGSPLASRLSHSASLGVRNAEAAAVTSWVAGNWAA